ncbi:hypothetical protein WS71_03660 [Burkholderia mayonis]|uniref:Uncharacterized protein n=1 Tax=Burkholderia mayonis TaxID=1385591 RepID=A0A1B4FSB0_9BURK|nr:hypothetical protein WS71_03660 [Burkholderia mayonis]KVE51257.1 hypothetical protein WS71_13180 [Burkholderia mayonis]
MPAGAASGQARDREGTFGCDLDKLMKLAADDSPELAQASAHAKDVLLTPYIRREVAGNRMNRAACELGRNALGIASGAARFAFAPLASHIRTPRSATTRTISTSTDDRQSPSCGFDGPAARRPRRRAPSRSTPFSSS